MYIKPGTFFTSFKTTFLKGNYPLIKKYYGKNFDQATPAYRGLTSATMAIVDSGLLKQEIWVKNSVKIYFPYSENFSTMYRPDNPGINQIDDKYMVTMVTADRDADSGPGREPYIYYGTTRGSTPVVKYSAVTVNDSYSEITPTHIVSIIDNVMDPAPPTTLPPISQPIYKSYIGWVKVNNQHQYDRLISFSGNGGGSELRFGRAYAFQDANGQVQTDMPFVQANLSRKAIRKGTWVHVLSLWDTNWRTDQLDHKLGIYEEDNKSSITFTGNVSLSATVSGITATRTLGFSVTKQSQDAIISNMNLDRDWYFHNGTTNQGWGMQDLWPILGGGSDVNYTMPYEIVY